MSEKPTKILPKLTIIGGVTRKSAVDENGVAFIEFHVDWLAGETVDYCAICETAIEEGWLSLSGGEIYCYEHVEEVGREDVPV